MWVKEIAAENFRNFENLKISLENGTNIVYGDNANGKTNFIEAIYFCATGKSRRANHDKELIRFGALEAHIQAVLDTRRIDVHLFREGKKKGIAIDHIPIKKLNQLFGILLVVIFTPEDLQMIKAGPGARRTFLDMELCQLSGVYYHALRQYYQALKQRNNLLKSIPKDRSLQDTLEMWDEPLCNYGTKIMEHRAAFIEELEKYAKDIHSDITSNAENLTVTYRPQVTDEFKTRLKRNIDRDIALGNTTVGIHRDEIAFAIDGNDVRTYGSQGQQRTTALSVKLAEIELIKNQTNNQPVLLLDDVLSELDTTRQQYLLQHITNQQTIITCTGIEEILKTTKANTLYMKNGILTQVR